jgi:hypothetical protein
MKLPKLGGVHGQLSFAQDWPSQSPQARRGPSRPARATPVSQIVLPLVTPKSVFTPLMAEVERILIRIAQVRGDMPNNPVLGQRAGGRGRSSVDRALRRLARIGRIRLEVEPGRRRVHLLAHDGLVTGWGEARPGHRPFCSRPKGTTAPIVKTRAPDSQPLPASAGTIPALASLAGMEWTPPAVAHGATRTCQWPMWGDDERPTYRFCDAATARSDSCWCEGHDKAAHKR